MSRTPNMKEVIRVTHNLRTKREEYGLSICDLSVLSDISVSAISSIESGRKPYKTNVGVALALAKALDCEVGDLFAKSELSHLGRPPHTGKPLSVEQELFPRDVLCLGCFLVVPAHIGCDNCGNQSAVAAVA